MSYKSEEKIFGLNVRIRDNGRESYKPDVLKDIYKEREQELSQISEMEQYSQQGNNYRKFQPFNSEKNFHFTPKTVNVDNSFEDDYNLERNTSKQLEFRPHERLKERILDQ